MYGYKWIDGENGIFKLDISVSVQKEIRPVFKEELDFFEMYKVWEYPDTDAPLLWAEGIRKYVLNGEVIAEAKGGSFYEKPKIVIKNTEVKKLEPIDVKRLTEVNASIMEGLTQRSVQFIRSTYDKYEKQGYKFVAAYSGGKDSIVILDLVQRALAPDQFIVVFGDTGMEFPDTYEVARAIKQYCQEQGIEFLTSQSVLEPEYTWEKFGPPAQTMRWCCSVHKSTPQTLKMRELAGKDNYTGLDFVGVRGAESVTRSQYEYEGFGKKQKGQ